jgi:hypothetical protein
MKYLEAQLCTGGIIDPRLSFRRPICKAVPYGLISKTIVEEIECHSDDLKFDVNGKNMTLTQLLEPENDELVKKVNRKLRRKHE